MEKVLPCKWISKKVRVTLLISEKKKKIDFKIKNITRPKE